MPKDRITEQLRQKIKRQFPWARETEEAEASLCALSLQSTTHPERHVWIDTDLDGIGLDLEDWQLDDEGDDTIARVKAESIKAAINIVGVWLSGANLPDWYTNINQEYLAMQPLKPIQWEVNRAIA